MFRYFAIFVILMSILALIFYGADKRKAQKNQWRTPEKLLLLLGFLGGAPGALLGMKLFHHKTKHWYFWAVNLLGLAWQLTILILLME